MVLITPLGLEEGVLYMCSYFTATCVLTQHVIVVLGSTDVETEDYWKEA